MASISRLGKAADIMEIRYQESAIEGKLTHRSYDDKMAKRYVTEVVVTEYFIRKIKQLLIARITKKNSCNLHFSIKTRNTSTYEDSVKSIPLRLKQNNSIQDCICCMFC
jgi:hypothetical protein